MHRGRRNLLVGRATATVRHGRGRPAWWGGRLRSSRMRLAASCCRVDAVDLSTAGGAASNLAVARLRRRHLRCQHRSFPEGRESERKGDGVDCWARQMGQNNAIRAQLTTGAQKSYRSSCPSDGPSREKHPRKIQWPGTASTWKRMVKMLSAWEGWDDAQF